MAEKVDAVNLEIDAAYDRKRSARMKAGTRDAEHPLIKEANREIRKLEAKRKKLWEEVKPHRKNADKRIDKKALNDAFRVRVNEAQRVKNTGGLDSSTANEIARYFGVARGRTFNVPGSRLRFHRFDGTGFLFCRFRRPGEKTDGVTLGELTRGEVVAAESFRLTPGKSRGGTPVMRLRAKVAGGAKRAGKVYAEFDLHLHRPIPEGAQINNAKLLRRRVGDRFRYAVSFSVRVNENPPAENPSSRAVGVDVGFKMRGGEYRAATIATNVDTDLENFWSAPDESGWRFHHVTLPGKYVERMKRVKDIHSKMDDSAKELGVSIRPLLKGLSLDESHPMYGLVRKITNAPANVTLSYELAYKLGGRIRGAPGSLPSEVEKEVAEMA